MKKVLFLNLWQKLIFPACASAIGVAGHAKMPARFTADGSLSFAIVSGAQDYRVEFSEQLDGSWHPFDAPYQHLNQITPDMSMDGWITVQAPIDKSPRFYRVIANTEPAFTQLAVIQAEQFTEMYGVQLEPGNIGIGWFDDGDWIKFERVDLGDGVASMTLSAAKNNGSSGAVEIRLDSPDGQLLGLFTPAETNGWDRYVSQSLNIKSATGVRDIYLIARSAAGVCNIDWFQFSKEPLHVPDYQLIWQDEFDGSKLDESKWHPVQHGFVDNGELQFYTDRESNIRVEDGYLWLTAIEEEYTGTGPWMGGQYKTSQFTSGKVQGQGKISFRYGKFEARMKLPRGAGTWPAFWMLGNNIPSAGWPRCGEIDIMEHAHILNNIGAAIHTESYNHMIGTQRTGGIAIDDYDTDFHVYGVEWTPQKLSFYLDDQNFLTLTKLELGDSEAEWPFDQPFWMILNLAVGGSWGGDPSGGDYPYSLQVDWVRVYQDQALGI